MTDRVGKRTETPLTRDRRLTRVWWWLTLAAAIAVIGYALRGLLDA
ncbi:hypothetical protein [Roseibium sp.]